MRRRTPAASSSWTGEGRTNFFLSSLYLLSQDIASSFGIYSTFSYGDSLTTTRPYTAGQRGRNVRMRLRSGLMGTHSVLIDCNIAQLAFRGLFDLPSCLFTSWRWMRRHGRWRLEPLILPSFYYTTSLQPPWNTHWSLELTIYKRDTTRRDVERVIQ